MSTMIGRFVKDELGVFHGKIYGLGLGVIPVMIEPYVKDGRVSHLKVIPDPFGDNYEVGRAWQKEKDGMIYHSVNLDSPSFPFPINTALFPDKYTHGKFNLVFDRPGQEQPVAESKFTATVPATDVQKRRLAAVTPPKALL